MRRRAAFHSEDEYRLAERRPLARTGDWTSHPEVRDAEIGASARPSGWCASPERLGKRIHVLHVTTAEEIEFLAEHKDVASVEVTPQHLTLTAPEAYERLKGLAQMNPPIRDAATSAGLWRGNRQWGGRRARLRPRAAHAGGEGPALSGLAVRACRACRRWCRCC